MLLGAILAGNTLMMVAYWVMLKEMRRDLGRIMDKVNEGIDNIEVDIPDLDLLKGEIVELMGEMHVPSWLDHGMGMVGQIMQARSSIRGMQIEASPEESIHNP